MLAKSKGDYSKDTLLDFYDKLTSGFRRYTLMDDPHMVLAAQRFLQTNECEDSLTPALLHSVLWGTKKPSDGNLTAVHNLLASKEGLKQDLIDLFTWLLQHRTPLVRLRFPEKTGPLKLHASYTRDQILLALKMKKKQSAGQPGASTFDLTCRTLVLKHSGGLTAEPAVDGRGQKPYDGTV